MLPVAIVALAGCTHVILAGNTAQRLVTSMSMLSMCSLCRPQLTGENLVPFTFDKQILFLDTIFSLFLCASSNVMSFCLKLLPVHPIWPPAALHGVLSRPTAPFCVSVPLAVVHDPPMTLCMVSAHGHAR